MRAKDELRLSVIRGIKSAITYKENEKLRKLDEPESIQLLQTLVKQRKESIDQFTKGNRNDLVEKEPKNSPSSKHIFLPAPAMPKWTPPSPKPWPKPAPLPSSKWVR